MIKVFTLVFGRNSDTYESPNDSAPVNGVYEPAFANVPNRLITVAMATSIFTSSGIKCSCEVEPASCASPLSKKLFRAFWK